MKTRYCNRCGKTYPLTEEHWYKNKGGRDGFGSPCKECRRIYRKSRNKQDAEYHKKYYKENKEKVLATLKDWREKNPEKLAIQKRKYYLSHKEKSLNQVKRWRKENREYVLAYRKKYFAENRKKILQQNKIGRLRRKGKI